MVTAFRVVVRIAHVLIQLLLGSFYRSHSPAKAIQLAVVDFEAVWLFGFPARDHA
jgi:hypothetical protein